MNKIGTFKIVELIKKNYKLQNFRILEIFKTCEIFGNFGIAEFYDIIVLEFWKFPKQHVEFSDTSEF